MDPLALTPQLMIDGVWTTQPAFAADGWSVSVGPDVETGARPNMISLSWNNDDLSLDPERADSALYDKIGLNTRARIRINNNTLTQAEASKWLPDRSEDHEPGANRGKADVSMNAEGILHRIQKWTDPLDSAMTTQELSYADALLGLWPLEDKPGSAQLANRSRGTAGTASGTYTLAGDDGPAGSLPIIEIGTGAALGGSFGSWNGSAGYQLCFSVRLDAAPSSGTYLPLFGWRDTAGRTWWWNVNNANFGIDCYDSIAGSLIVNHVVNTGGIDLTRPTRCRVKLINTGGNTTIEYAWYQQDDLFIYGTSTTMSDVPVQPASWFVNQNAWNLNGGIGHVFAVNDLALDLTGDYDAAASFNGYLRERAGRRWMRLMTQAGLDKWITGDPDATPRMGRQPATTLLDNLTQCVVTMAGLMYDEPLDIALRLRTWEELINQTPVLALVKSGASGTVAIPFRRATDDHGVANDINLENSDGTKAHAELATGRRSVLPPPAGVGRYKAGSDLAINYAYAIHVQWRATWELAKGTVDRPRFPKVVVKLHAHPSLTNTVTLMRPGDWITVEGELADLITLRVISIERGGDAVEDTVTFNCLPAEPYMIAVADDGETRVGSSSHTVATAVNTTATTLVVRTPYRHEWWTTRAASFPHDIMVAGERMTVTAAGAAAYSSGYWQQSLTVTRSVNGIVKSQAVNAGVQIAGVRRVGLAA